MNRLPWLALVGMLATTLGAAAPTGCTSETLTLRGTPVNIGYCVNGTAKIDGSEMALPVAETYATADHSFSRSTTLRFVSGDGPSRVLENVALDQLGVTGTLHLTLLYTGGSVHIENALLTPGAITIK